MGVVSIDIYFEGLFYLNLAIKFCADKLKWIGWITAKFRDSSSRISWFVHQRFLPAHAHPMVIALPADATKNVDV